MDLFSDLLGRPDEQTPEPLTTPATQAPQQSKSLFDSLLDAPDTGALHTNLAGAAATTPDAHQKAVDDGKTLDIPADVAARNRAETEKQARIQRYRDALNDAPKMQKLLAEDPDLAKLSADDLKILGGTEKTLSFFGSVGRGIDLLQSNLYGFAEATGEATGFDSLTGFGREGRVSNLAEAQQYGDRTSLFSIGSVGEAGQFTKETIGEQLPLMAPSVAGGLTGAGVGFATFGPPGALIGSIIGAFLPSFALGVGETQGAIKEKDPDAVAPGYAFGAGALIGILDSALPGKVGSTLVKVLGREGTEQVLALTARRLAADTAKGATLEGTTEAVQEAIGEVAASTATGQEIDTKALAEQMVEAFVVGFGMGGGVEGGSHIVSTIGRNRERATETARNTAVIEALVKGTADSKLRDRNPDAFSRVMAAQTQGTPVETFYVPATAIAELYQDGSSFSTDDDPLNQIEGLAEQYQEALAVGGDVEISAADYLTHIAPTDVHGRLKNDLRASRDGWSVNDAKAYAENPDRESDLASLVEKLALENEGAAVGQTVFDDTYKQLMDTGQYQSHQAAAQATLVRERYLTRAERLGNDADALYLRDQVRVHGPGALARVQRGDLDLVIARLKSGETVTADKTPVLDIVRKAGGVKPKSNLAGELQAMGITSRTHPGLFRKTGIGDVDNVVLAQHDVLRDNGVPDSGNGYADKDAVLEALRREAGGRGAALLTQDERTQRARLDEPVAVLAEQMEAAGLDPNAMTADEIKAWATALSELSAEQATDAAPADGQGVLLQGAPVATLTGNEIALAGTALKKLRLAAKAWYAANLAGTTVVNPSIGEITFDGRDKALATSADPRKLQLFPAVRDILERGRVGDPEPNADPKTRDSILSYRWITAPVSLGGQVVQVSVNVEERVGPGKKGKQFYYNHSMPPDRQAQSGGPIKSGDLPSSASPDAGSPPLPELDRRSPDQDISSASDNVNLTISENPTELFQSVYHGSPHIFDKFSTSAINSGEGAQVQGWGLYFASKKSISQWYRDQLSDDNRTVTVDGTSFADPQRLRDHLSGKVSEAHPDIAEWEAGSAADDVARRVWQGQSVASILKRDPSDRSADWLRAYRAAAEMMHRAETKDQKGGRLYTVEIPDDGEYLLHDKPLSEQPEAVRKALEGLDLTAESWQRDNGFMAGFRPDPHGQDLYKMLSQQLGSDRAASEALLAAGVRGIKYLDASARDSSGDSFNYVIFADADAVIQAYEQSAAGGARGSYQRAFDPYGNPANIIKLTQNADLSTFTHEMGHFFLFQMIDDATLPGATDEARGKLQADLQAILDHVGVKIDVATATADQIHAVMTRDAHELWARSFEVYLREGKAPSSSLRDAFASFSAWLTRIYKTLTSIPDYRKNLTPEVRGVMDRLLATDEAIADAQNASSFRVPGALRQVMTAAEQRSLERLTEQANREAKEDLLKRVMKELERERLEWWKEERAKVRAEVEAEVKSRPVYRAYNIIRTGATADGGQLVDENGNPRAMKLDRKQLERDYGKDVIKLLPKGLTAKDGASHHVVAGLTGFGSADELRDALMNFRPMKEVVEEETDAAMKARHGDMLSDGRLAEDAAELVLNDRQLELAALQAKALRRLASSVMTKAAARTVAKTGAGSASEDRARVAAAQADVEAVAGTGIPAEGVAGLSVEGEMARATAAAGVGQRGAQQAALRQTRGIASGIDLKAIQAAAKRAIAGKRVEDAVPGKYRAQADRLGRKIEEAIAKRDYETAATLKEQQLINLALAREAQEAQARVEKAVKRFARLRKPDSKLAKTQNIDFVGAARAILTQFGLSSPQAGFDSQVWFQRLKEDSPGDEIIVQELIAGATANAGTVAARGRTRTRQQRPGGQPVAQGQVWRQMTVSEFDGLTDTVDGILHMGRESRTAEIDGERVERKQINADLAAQVSNRDNGKRIGQTAAITGMDRAALVMGSMAAASERAEHWARRMDLDDTNGPFTRYFIKPILAAVYAYREDKAARLKALVEIIEPRKKELFGKKIPAGELNYTFANKGELLHAILHTGNDSNMRKLLLGGRGKGFAWGEVNKKTGALDTSRWDNMIRRMVQEGVLTKADYDTAQQIWDLLESTKGPAQIAWRKMKGYYFQEVEITGINTPFGRYKGGYVPALTEADMNEDGGQRSDADAIGQLANGGMMPTVDAGFTKSRVEYNRPLQLNLMKLPSHLDKVLKMTHLGPAVQQAGRLAVHRDFKEMMFGIDQNIIDGMLMPWLGRVARQSVELPSTTKAGRYADVFFRGLRKHTGLQAMAGNLINALQQILGPIPALTEVSAAAMMRGVIANVRRPYDSVAVMTSKSPFMKDRMNGASQELMGTLDDIINNKGTARKLKKMGERHGYFAQTFMQNLVDRVVWQGGYDQAIAAGKSEADAVFDADSAVRITQGSFAPEDVSAAEAKIAFSRLFTQFYSYFNTQLNLARSKADITITDLGWAGASPKLFYIYVLTVMAPAVLSEVITQAARGGLGDDDDDGMLDDMAELFFMSQIRYMAAFAPGLGQFVNYLIARTNDNPADDRISTSPALNALETVGRAPFTIWDAVVEDGKASKAIKDGLNAIGVITGLPLGQLGKPLGYIADVATGEQEGETVGDWMRGVFSGREAPKQ